jgi:anti-sigma28 factor (negative regulator of flagellin synthesis)
VKSKVGISGDAVQLSMLSGTMRADQTDSPERTAHVAEVTDSVQSGRYQVDPAVVSASIIDRSMRAAA